MAKPSLATLVNDYLRRRRPERITPAEWRALQAHLADCGRPLSRSRLLELLHATDIEIDRALGGLPPDLRDRVRTRDLESAARSLSAMAEEYSRAHAAGDKPRAGDCRRAVLAGKERLNRSLRNPRLSEAKRREKQELLEWFGQWLEAPSLFADWLELRRRRGTPPAPG